MSSWHPYPVAATSQEHTPRAVNQRFVVALVILCIFIQPLVWNSEAIAQEIRAFPIHAVNLDERSPGFVEKGSAHPFFASSRNLRKSADQSAEEAFFSPDFVSEGQPAAGTVKAFGEKVPLRLAILALNQGENSSPSTQSATPPSGGSTPTAKKKSNKWIWILVAAGGGAAVAVLAMKKSPSESTSPGTPGNPGNTTTVTLGTPTVGAP